MKKSTKKILGILLAILILCFGIVWTISRIMPTRGDIIILYTNDIHCGIEDDIGYAGLVEYKEALEEKTPHVTLVDCGDAIQGEFIGLVSEGSYIIDIMNEAGYDLAVLGNHEFDYGMEQLETLIGQSDAQY